MGWLKALVLAVVIWIITPIIAEYSRNVFLELLK
jgi:hypothetical protein